MKILRFVLINIVVLFLLLSLFSVLLPSHVRISRAVDIDVPLSLVSAKTSRLDEWGEWNEFVKELKTVKATGETISSTPLKISLVKNAPDTLVTTWKQQNGKTFTSAFSLSRQASTTTLQWYFDFTFRWYPWERFSSIVYDQQLGPQMEQSLSNLKRLLEKAS